MKLCKKEKQKVYFIGYAIEPHIVENIVAIKTYSRDDAFEQVAFMKKCMIEELKEVHYVS